MKLRLYHHPDGARVAYRETGTGPGLVLLHSALLSHREFEPVVEHLSDRYRLILPDLPLHGDSEDRPRHPYTLDWLAEVIAAFCLETAGPRPLVGGHELGAMILLEAIHRGSLVPGKQADLTVLSLSDTGFIPWEDPVTGAVLGGSPHSVVATLVSGQPRYEKGGKTWLELIDAARSARSRLLQSAGPTS